MFNVSHAIGPSVSHAIGSSVPQAICSSSRCNLKTGLKTTIKTNTYNDQVPHFSGFCDGGADNGTASKEH